MAQIENHFHMLEIDASKVAFGELDGAPDESAGHGFWERRQNACAEFDAAIDEKHLKFGNFGLPIGFLLAREIGQMSERVLNFRIPLRGELRQKSMANAVARKTGIEIGSVLAPGNVLGAEKRFDLGAGHVNEGPDEMTRDWRDRGESG